MYRLGFRPRIGTILYSPSRAFELMGAEMARDVHIGLTLGTQTMMARNLTATVTEQDAQDPGKALIPGYRAVCFGHPQTEPMIPPWQGEWRTAWYPAQVDAREHNHNEHGGPR